MNRLLALLAFCLFSAAASARASVFVSDGSLADTQAKVNGVVAGDTVFIPVDATWAGTLVITKNIKLLGWGPGRPQIRHSGTTPSILHYTVENSVPKHTAEIGNLEFYGELNKKVFVDGIGTIDQNGDNYVGGLRIHHCTFSSDWNSTAGISGSHYWQEGWVFGVIDHCEIFDDLQRVGGETFNINHNGSPTNPGAKFGDYAWSFPTDGSELAGSLNTMVLEDCIFHHPGAATDTSGAGTGSGIHTIRHCLSWSPLATHGTRESTGNGHGARLSEVYNDMYVRQNAALQPNKRGVGPTEIRDGEVIALNDYIVVAADAGGFDASTDHWTQPSAYCVAHIPNFNRWAFAPDALNPWDENQQGDFTDPILGGPVHRTFTTYDHTSPAGDHVVNGQDVDGRFGDVYGTSSGGTLSADGLTLSGATIAGTDLPSPIPADYFRGHVIRNPDIARSQQNPRAFMYILGNTAAGAGTPNTVTFTFLAPWGINGRLANADGMELRKVKTYMNVPGSGPGDSTIKIDSLPALLESGSPNPRWTNQRAAGMWIMGCMRRIGTGPWQREGEVKKAVGNGTDRLVYRDFHHLFDFAYNYSQSDFKPGYRWDPTVPAGDPRTRVGPDWSRTYPDGTDTSTGAFASFYMRGAVDMLPYPHPLVAMASKPSPTPTPSATPSPTPSPTPEPTPSGTPEPSATPTPIPTPTPTPNPDPTATPTPEPSTTPIPEPSPSPSPTPDPTPSPTPDPLPSPTATPEPTPSPSVSPTPDPSPSITPLSNTPPKSHAGSDKTIRMPNSVMLYGSASDDGRPSPPAKCTFRWSKVSGPGTITWGAQNSLTTKARFSSRGTYVLKLTVYDGALRGTDTVTVTVKPRL